MGFIIPTLIHGSIVGVVEVGGKISVGESVEVVPERLPKWLRKPI